MKNFIYKIEEVLEVNLGSIKECDQFRELEEWDSLSSLALSAMIDEEYDLIIPRTEFDKLITVGDIFNYVQSNKEV
jgi:acyl carrier protein